MCLCFLCRFSMLPNFSPACLVESVTSTRYGALRNVLSMVLVSRLPYSTTLRGGASCSATLRSLR
ncbi:hypothetical protein PR003_g22868 [Phytophthora rubi]|uniref:Secreted protein n=1 Tax=Phytophthora rubi TaxID=129364 RepID=A0A6A3MMQ1_9STRA|nr:hypothetical protein PR002_g24625 [Phytophthora rubi]KAE9034175.1 hypothetical protein PR001_g9849 [Phytophthora rubi]KAE9299945.1 hypothetical protein PR003_g22868 [Phytophthora rubi]